MTGKTSRKSFTRFATLTSLAISPVVLLLQLHQGYSLTRAAIVTLVGVAAFRYLIDWFTRALVEHPNLFEDVSPEARSDDARYRRRMAFWVHKFRLTSYVAGIVTLTYVAQKVTGGNVTWTGTLHAYTGVFHSMFGSSQARMNFLQILILFPANFLLFMGPMLATGISQVRGFEPGDANWGVNLDDVRGQKEAKDEIRKIITLWQSGERFVRAGGKRERGILFLGAPGTGKTMLAKAIATGFNSPIVTIPGSGFAQTFVGIDAVIVRFLIRKAKKLARKWSGQCIIFIDEIDAVGMRRGSLGVSSQVNQIPGGMFGGGMGSMALNQLLVAMDGIDSPPFMRRVLTNKVNLYLDSLYVIPARVGRLPLRLPSAKPRGEQVYFIGATNVPLEALDPALVRPGRMGRHIHFRTPTKRDRIDIFDLYLGKVAHDSVLDDDHAREELARVTSGYSPADIEQACSLALMYANFSGRDQFSREDILEAMVTVEAGTALGWGYEKPEEELSTAIHEAGHAVCAHVYMPDVESTRLSVVRRGATGGHHQIADIEERTFRNRSDLFYNIVWGLGAYAAELLFYGHNTQGVGGDLGGTSAMAARMVGQWGMAPMTDDLDDATVKRLKKIGKRLLVAARPGDITLSKEKYDDEALLIGHAFIVAYCTIKANKLAVEKIAQTLVSQKEVYGDDLVKLLRSCELYAPEIDFESEETWPSFG